MKKILCSSFVVVVLVALCACATTSKSTATASSGDAPAAPTEQAPAEEAPAEAAPEGTDGGSVASAEDSSPKGDFSSPTAAVETMIRAGAAKDLDLLSECFSDDAPGEFDAVKNKTADDALVQEFADFVTGGTVTGETIAEDGNTAEVAAKLGRDESISLQKTDGGWKVVDF